MLNFVYKQRKHGAFFNKLTLCIEIRTIKAAPKLVWRCAAEEPAWHLEEVSAGRAWWRGCGAPCTAHGGHCVTRARAVGHSGNCSCTALPPFFGDTIVLLVPQSCLMPLHHEAGIDFRESPTLRRVFRLASRIQHFDFESIYCFKGNSLCTDGCFLA